jgi:hypothetical protein
MALAGTCLFVGGGFERAGNTTSSRAAIWSLTANDWQALGDGIGGGDLDSEVRTIAVGSGQVFFGGEFWYAGDGQSGSFAIWNLTPRAAPDYAAGRSKPDAACSSANYDKGRRINWRFGTVRLAGRAQRERTTPI